MTRAQVMALIGAHYERDESRFRGLVLQIAAGFKSYADQQRLRALTNTPELKTLELAPDVRELVCALEPRELDSLCLTPEITSVFDRVIAEHFAREGFAGTGLQPTSRLLFHGPPGNGKTSAAAALCARLGLDVFGLSLDGTTCQYLGATSKNIRKALSALGEGRALVMDELDAVAHNRDGGDNSASHERNLTVATLLTLLDRSFRGMLVATTNRLEAIDPAVVRRFDLVLEFPAPTDAQKMRLATRLATRFQLELSPELRGLALSCKSFDAVEREIIQVARRAIVARYVAGDERAAE